jgi:hypothetical protein
MTFRKVLAVASGGGHWVQLQRLRPALESHDLAFVTTDSGYAIWIDSIANVDEMSLTGRLVKPYADLWLTQWPHLATPEGPQHAGAVI